MNEDPEARRLLEGDAGTIEAITSSIRRVVVRFGTVLPSGREEMVQEALGRLFISVSRGRFRGEAPLAAYAASVARITCLEHVRRRRVESRMDLHTVPSRARWALPEESLLRSEEHDRNLRAFAALPAECRRLLLTIFVQGLSYREAAGRLGISEGAVKLRVLRCRRRATGLRETSAAPKSLTGGTK